MGKDAGSRVKNRGAWTYVQKVKSGNESFYVNVTCPEAVPPDAVDLSGGVCAKARCKTKSVCFREIRFEDGHRGYEFSCAVHKDKLGK